MTTAALSNSKSLHRRLARYGLVAGAAAGAAAMGAPEAEGAGVITFGPSSSLPGTGEILLAFDQTGTIVTNTAGSVPLPGIQFKHYKTGSGPSFPLPPTSFPQARDAIFATALAGGGGTARFHPTPLGADQIVGPGGIMPSATQGLIVGNYATKVGKSGPTKIYGNTKNTGPWVGQDGEYFGFSFTDTGGTYYGWAQLSTSLNSPGQIGLIGGAVNTTPGAPLATGAIPEPSRALLLAMGATGVLALRRRKEAA